MLPYVIEKFVVTETHKIVVKVDVGFGGEHE